MIKKAKEFLIQNKFYLIYAIVLGIFIITYNYNLGDDIYYRKQVLSLGILRFSINEYLSWSGRVSTIIISSIGYKYIIIWKVTNILIIFLFIKSFSYYYKIDFSNKERLKIDRLLLVCLFLVFPYTIISSSIWLSGSYQYIWVATAFLYAMFPFYKIIFISNELKFLKIHWFFYYLSMFYTAYVEQEYLIIFILGMISTIYIYKDKNILFKDKVKIYFYYLFFLGNFLIARLSPGLPKRVLAATRAYPNWNNLSIIYKFYEVVNLTNHYLISGSNLIFFIFLLFLSILIYKKWGLNIKILFIPLIYITLKLLPLDLISKNLLNWYTTADGGQVLFLEKYTNFFLFDVFKGVNNIKLDKIEYLPAIIMFFIIIFTSFILYSVFDDKKKGVLSFLLYWAGLFSVYILAFMPAVYAIGSRAFLILNILIIFIILQIYLELKLKFEIDKSKSFKILIFVLSIISFLVILNYPNFIKTGFF